MKVRLYAGSLRLVEKSGVGQAILHQRAMLNGMGVETTEANDKAAPLVHINTVFPDSLCAAILARLRGQKVVYYAHSTMEDFRNSLRASNFFAPLFKQWIKLCYSMGDVIITPTMYSRRLLLSYGIKKPVYALSNGIDTDFFAFSPAHRRAFRSKYNLRETDKAVISVGHFIERKGILDFITLARAMPEVRFFWFGYTNLSLIPPKVRAAVASAPPNVCFPGYVAREELRDAYCGCDLFCFMSYEETEGIVVLEALACTIPMLVRDIPVYEGWLTDGENVYKAREQYAFFQYAAKILNAQFPNLTEAGRLTAVERSIPKIGKRLIDIYKDVLEFDMQSFGARDSAGESANFQPPV